MSTAVLGSPSSRTLHTPVHNLPPELLIRIFEAGQTNDLFENMDWTMLCAAVCQYWRQSCLDAPQLWRTITIHLPHQVGMGAMWRTMQSRSSPYTIDILIRLDFGHTPRLTDDVVGFIADNCERMRSFDVKLRGGQVLPPFAHTQLDQGFYEWISRLSSTSLESLGIHVSGSSHPVVYDMNLPRLQDLKLTNSMWEALDGNIPSFATHITTLKLTQTRAYMELAPDMLLELLSGMPALEELTLCLNVSRFKPDRPQPHAWPIAELPALCRLYLHLDVPMVSSSSIMGPQVLHRIVCPALETLHISCPVEEWAFYRAMLTREGLSYPSLRSLRSQVDIMSVDQFPPALPGLRRACPCLDELIFPVHLSRSTDGLKVIDERVLMHSVQWASYGPWPRLRVLDMSESWEDRAYIMPRITTALDEVRSRGKPKVLLKLDDPRFRDDPELCATLLQHTILL